MLNLSPQYQLLRILVIAFKKLPHGHRAAGVVVWMLFKKRPFRLLYNQGCPAVAQFPTERSLYTKVTVLKPKGSVKKNSDEMAYQRNAQIRTLQHYVHCGVIPG